MPAPPKQKTATDLLAAVRLVFRGRLVPAARRADRPATGEQLKEKACALRKAFDFEACDCEYLERGSTRAGATSATLGEFKLEVAAAERYA